MSNDLISRNDAECMIHDYFTSLIEKHIQEIDVVDCNAELQKRLDNISVAYDQDKVMKQILNITVNLFAGRSNGKTLFAKTLSEYRRMVVDVVKEGGVNEK